MVSALRSLSRDGTAVPCQGHCVFCWKVMKSKHGVEINSARQESNAPVSPPLLISTILRILSAKGPNSSLVCEAWLIILHFWLSSMLSLHPSRYLEKIRIKGSGKLFRGHIQTRVLLCLPPRTSDRQTSHWSRQQMMWFTSQKMSCSHWGPLNYFTQLVPVIQGRERENCKCQPRLAGQVGMHWLPFAFQGRVRRWNPISPS